MLGVADGVGHAALEIEHLLQIRREARKVVGGLRLGPRLLGDRLQLGDGGHQVGGDAARDVVRLARLSYGPHAIRIRRFAGDLGLGGGDQATRLIGCEAILRDARHRGKLIAARRRGGRGHLRPAVPRQQVDDAAEVVDFGEVVLEVGVGGHCYFPLICEFPKLT